VRATAAAAAAERRGCVSPQLRDDPRFLRPREASSHRHETEGDTNLDAIIESDTQARAISMRSHCAPNVRARCGALADCSLA